jgi:ABC-2 type transport system ATP-binding protein
MSSKVIEIQGLTKKYGSFTAVDNLNMSVSKGEIFGLLGPNGAGKSTTILMLMGLTEPSSGIAKICGIDPSRNPVDVKKKVGYLPEDVGFYDNLTGLENLIYTAQLNSIPLGEARQRANQLISKVGLSNEGEKKAGKYSRGMRQRLGLADVLIKNPEVIILDEPTMGIDPAGIKDFLELIVHLSREEGITVLFSSHLLHQVQKVCDRVGIFVSGRLLAEGDINSLARKLFATSALTIEIGIYPASSEKGRAKVKSITAEGLKNKLQGIEGVDAVKMNNNIFQVECSSDISSQLARAVINSGADLNYLNKKEYGLDDIYYRYFEGGNSNE